MDTELRICADLILIPGALACLRSPKARYKASDCTWASLPPSCSPHHTIDPPRPPDWISTLGLSLICFIARDIIIAVNTIKYG